MPKMENDRVRTQAIKTPARKQSRGGNSEKRIRNGGRSERHSGEEGQEPEAI